MGAAQDRRSCHGDRYRPTGAASSAPWSGRLTPTGQRLGEPLAGGCPVAVRLAPTTPGRMTYTLNLRWKLHGEAYRCQLSRHDLARDDQGAGRAPTAGPPRATASIPPVVRDVGQRRGNAVEHVFQASLEFPFQRSSASPAARRCTVGKRRASISSAGSSSSCGLPASWSASRCPAERAGLRPPTTGLAAACPRIRCHHPKQCRYR